MVESVRSRFMSCLDLSHILSSVKSFPVSPLHDALSRRTVHWQELERGVRCSKAVWAPHQVLGRSTCDVKDVEAVYIPHTICTMLCV